MSKRNIKKQYVSLIKKDRIGSPDQQVIRSCALCVKNNPHSLARHVIHITTPSLSLQISK